MLFAKTLPAPHWVTDTQSPKEFDHAQLRFYLRLAALYHNPKGSMCLLSRAIGLSEPALVMIHKRGNMTGEVAVGIEKAVGRALFPRELFRPDLFTIDAE